MSSGTAMPSRTRGLEGMGDRLSQETRVPCAELLCKTQLFAGLSDAQLAAVILLCRQLQCREGQILCSEGDVPAEVFVVLQGEVTVEFKLFQDFHLRSKAVAVEKIGTWGVIDCCALVERRMNMTARCTKDTEIVAVNAGELRKLLAARPDIGLIVMENAFTIAIDRLVLAWQQLVAQFGLREMYQTYRNY
jgi:hypothetical protein